MSQESILIQSRVGLLVSYSYLVREYVYVMLISQYDEPDLNKSHRTRPKTPTASKVIPLGSRITVV